MTLSTISNVTLSKSEELLQHILLSQHFASSGAFHAMLVQYSRRKALGNGTRAGEFMDVSPLKESF